MIKIKFGKHSFKSFEEFDSAQKLATQNGIKSFEEFIKFLDSYFIEK